MPRFAYVLNFEATCDAAPAQLQNEVIEFPGVLIDLQINAIISDDFQQYVMPVLNPVLTAFCTELTGITNEVIGKSGVSFPTALERHRDWLLRVTGLQSESEIESEVIFVTGGDWDLKTMLPQQSEISKISVPLYLQKWCNIRLLYMSFFQKKKSHTGMTLMLDQLGIPLEGKLHSGIDDCKNIARILNKLVSLGCKVKHTAQWNAATGKIDKLPLISFPPMY